MDEQELALFLMINEPTFHFRGKAYGVCCPDGTFATWDSDGNTFDYPDVHTLLDGWMIAGKPFRMRAAAMLPVENDDLF